MKFEIRFCEAAKSTHLPGASFHLPANAGIAMAATTAREIAHSEAGPFSSSVSD
jgi:hypothetical protein